MRGRLPALLCAALLAGGATTAVAQEPATPEPCSAFDWSIQRELAWFAAPGLPRLASGATLPEAMPGAVLALSAEAQAHLPLAPSRQPKPETRGGTLTAPAPVTPGLYQVTLSENAWIDVSQDGATTRPPVATTMRPGCQGVVKSLRYQFGTQPILIMVSGAAVDAIAIAVAPAE